MMDWLVLRSFVRSQGVVLLWMGPSKALASSCDHYLVFGKSTPRKEAAGAVGREGLLVFRRGRAVLRLFLCSVVRLGLI